jgi:hypothetical protein
LSLVLLPAAMIPKLAVFFTRIWQLLSPIFCGLPALARAGGDMRAVIGRLRWLEEKLLRPPNLKGGTDDAQCVPPD